MKNKEIILKRSGIIGVVYYPYKPSKGFLDKERQCLVIVYAQGINQSINYTFGKDSEKGFKFYTNLKEDLNNKDIEFIEVSKLMYDRE